jgi:hypothetical protein
MPVPGAAATVALLATAVPAHASTPSCALGKLPPELKTVLPNALASEQSKFAKRLDALSAADRTRATDAFGDAAAAYVYGMPTVLLRLTIAQFPTNTLVGVGGLATPTSKGVVAPNHDTLYSTSRIDLGAGPFVIDAPATHGRYSVVQLLDANTNAFDYIGSGSDRDRASSTALVPPGWNGTLPPGVRKVESPTKIVWLLGRTLVDDDADLPAARALMAQYALTPLDAWANGARSRSSLTPGPVARPPVHVPTGASFYTGLDAALTVDPPPAADACAMDAFAGIGVGAGKTPSTDPVVARALAAAPAAGSRLVDTAVSTLRRTSQRKNNGWWLSAGDVARFGTDYSKRAAIARIGLASNTPDEALYPTTDTDVDGKVLSGKRGYTVTFRKGELPPVRSFWSLTMYNSALSFVANPIDRYALGDRSPGLRYGKDGSLTLYVQHGAPPASRKSNWLPAPSGRFSLYLRLYEPKPAAADGKWTPPTVKRVR